MYRSYLESNVVFGVQRERLLPYMRLKYYTWLMAALLDNCRDGHEFANLLLVVDHAGGTVPHRTVYTGEDLALRIDAWSIVLQYIEDARETFDR